MEYALPIYGHLLTLGFKKSSLGNMFKPVDYFGYPIYSTLCSSNVAVDNPSLMIFPATNLYEWVISQLAISLITGCHCFFHVHWFTAPVKELDMLQLDELLSKSVAASFANFPGCLGNSTSWVVDKPGELENV